MDNDSLIISLIGYIAFCGMMVAPLWTIFGRTGMPRWYSVLFVLPVSGPLLVLYLLAYRSWPLAVGRRAEGAGGPANGSPAHRASKEGG